MPTQSIRTHADGRRITERETRRGLRLNIIAGTTGLLWFVVTMNYPLSMLLDTIGASGLVIGLVAVAGQVTMAAQIPASFYAERLPTRKKFWAFCLLCHRPLLVIPALLAFFLADNQVLVQWLIVVVMFISWTLFNCGHPLWLSWMADFVPERIRGRFYGLRQSISMTGNLCGVALAGFLLDAFKDKDDSSAILTGFVILFAVAALLGTLDIVIHLWVPEPKPRARTRKSTPWQRLREPFSNPDFFWLTMAIAAWTFSGSLVGQFGNLYLRRVYDAPFSHLSYLAICGSIGGILLSPFWGYLIDRIGARSFGALMMFIGPMLAFRWFVLEIPLPSFFNDVSSLTGISPPLLLIMITNPIAWAIYLGVPLCQMGLASALAPKEGRTMAMAVHLTIIGCMAAVGSVCGGLIVDLFPQSITSYVLPLGTSFGFIHVLMGIHVAIAWLLAIPMLLTVKEQAGDIPVAIAARRLLVRSPVRTARNIYSLTTAVIPITRAKALQALGQERTEIAVSDLIEKLDDPSIDVREQAAFALGKIGSPEAVDALISKLYDPHVDLVPQIARSLRQSKDPRSVDALVDKLHDSDRETRSETARTLGAIGDRRASEPLLKLLRDAEDDKDISASSEALARLGELAAIYDILTRMEATRNPVLKRSLAVAVGDMIGERDGFYQVIAREEKTRGGEVERMLNTLRKDITKAANGQFDPKALCGKCDELESFCEEDDYDRCSRVLLEMAVGIAALKYGLCYGGDARVFVDEIMWRDERFAIGAWYINLLTETSRCRDIQGRIEILLGVYFLSQVKLKQ